MAVMRNAYKMLSRKPEGKRTLGTTRYRWQDNSQMDFQDSGQCPIASFEHSNESSGFI
jgi:hypothetical protein